MGNKASKKGFRLSPSKSLERFRYIKSRSFDVVHLGTDIATGAHKLSVSGLEMLKCFNYLQLRRRGKSNGTRSGREATTVGAKEHMGHIVVNGRLACCHARFIWL